MLAASRARLTLVCLIYEVQCSYFVDEYLAELVVRLILQIIQNSIRAAVREAARRSKDRRGLCASVWHA